MVKTSPETLALCKRGILRRATADQSDCNKRLVVMGFSVARAKKLCSPNKKDAQKLCSKGKLFSNKEVRQLFREELKAGVVNPTKKFGSMVEQLEMFESYPKVYKLIRTAGM